MEKLLNDSKTTAWNQEEIKTQQGKRVFKSLLSKAKLFQSSKLKRTDYKMMDIGIISPKNTVISLNDDGKCVLRRNSFIETTARSWSQNETAMLKNLLSTNRSLNQSEDSNGSKCSSNSQRKTSKNDLLDESTNAPNFWRERRGAIAEVTPRDRDVIVRELRRRAFAKNLTSNGLL